MFGQIVEETFPFWHAPNIGLFMSVEADQECRDQIKFSEVGQGIESFDLPDHTTHAEQMREVAKHGELVQIQPEPLVTEQLRDVKEISRTTAKIENAFRPGKVELDLANPANVDGDPSFEVKKFGPVRAGPFHRVAPPNLLEPLGVDRFNHSPCLEAKTLRPKKSERMPSCAGQASAIHKFFELMRKFF